MIRHIQRYAAAGLRWLKGREPLVFLVLLGLAAGTWGFIEIADEVMEGDTQAFDEWAVRAMRRTDDPAVPVGPGWLQEMGRDATALGGTGALVLFTAVAAGYLWIDGKTRMMLLLVISTVSGLVVSLGLKSVFARPRPDVVPHLSIIQTSSFPSGHSMLSAVVYLTLGSLLAAVIPRRVLKVYVLGIAILFTVLVGVSRVYLGVHYPTDVLAGWSAGLIWALLCWATARWLQDRRQVEGVEETEAPISNEDET